MKTGKKKILIFTYTDVACDSIVMNQINWLKHDYELYVACKKGNDVKGVEYFKYETEPFFARNIRTIYLKTGLYYKYIWSSKHKKLANELNKVKYDLIIVHHIRLLPVAAGIAAGCPVLFYAHEFYPRMYEHSFIWNMIFRKYYIWIGKKYIPLCDYLLTVNESIKNIYEKEYGVKAGFIHNTVGYYDNQPTRTDGNNIKIIHHGLASTSRKLELMIEMIKYLEPRFSLTLALQSNGFMNDFYIKRLKKLAGTNPRITFRGLVGFDEIVSMGNLYDIGIFFMPPTTINEKYSLGHKIFQYIQSGLMLVVSPLPEMKNLVEKYNLGIVADSFDAKRLAAKMNTLTVEEIMYYKNQSRLSAKELSGEGNADKLRDVIKTVINKGRITERN